MNVISELNAWRYGSFSTTAYSDKGGREDNQDNYLILGTDDNGKVCARFLQEGQPVSQKSEDWPRNRIRLLVCDGLGGHPMARQAAELTVAQAAQIPPCDSQEDFYIQLLQLHRSLYQHSELQVEDGKSRPATTLVWAELDSDSGRCFIGAVGDSRAYLLRQGQLQSLTVDHNENEFAKRERRECRENPNTLRQALGFGHTRQGVTNPNLNLLVDTALTGWPFADDNHFDVFTLSLQADDVLLLATDGLWSHQPDRVWRPQLSYAPKIESELADWIQQARATHVENDTAMDNATLLCCSRLNASGGLPKHPVQLPRRETKALSWQMIVVMLVFVGLFLGLSFRLSVLKTMDFYGQSDTTENEDHQLFNELKAAGLLQVDDDLRLRLPSSDFLLSQTAQGIDVANEQRELLEELYQSAGGAMLRQQIEQWNQTRTLAGVRDNRNTLSWRVVKENGGYQKGFNNIPEVFGFFHQRVSGGYRYSALRTELGPWFAASPSGAVRFERELAPQKNAFTIQFLGRLQSCRLSTAARTVDCGQWSKPVCTIGQGLYEESDCVEENILGGEITLPTHLSGGLQIVLQPVSASSQKLDDMALKYASVANGQDLLAGFSYDAAKTLQSPGKQSADNHIMQIGSADGQALTDEKGHINQLAKDLALLPMLGEKSEYGSLPWLLSNSGLNSFSSLQLSVDTNLQKAALESLQTGLKNLHQKISRSRTDRYLPLRQAALVVLDVDNGDILAAAGLPLPPDTVDPSEYRAFNKAFPINTPYRNLVWQAGGSRQTPGSTLKVLTGLAALDFVKQNAQDVNTDKIKRYIKGLSPRGYYAMTGLKMTESALPIYDQEYLNKGIKQLNLSNYGDAQILRYFNQKLRKVSEKGIVGCSEKSLQKNTLGMEAALMKSSNVWFAQLAEMLDGDALKAIDFKQTQQKPEELSYLLKFIDRLDLNESMPLYHLPETPKNAKAWKHSPYVNSAAMELALSNSGNEEHDATARFDLLQMGIGQGVQVTPLQMARLASLAASGQWRKPRWFSAWDDESIEVDAGKKLNAELALLRSGMQAVVQTGTASTAFNHHPDQCRVFGKTGTAQVKKGKHKHNSAWFIGWREPEQDNEKRLAFACMVTHVPVTSKFGGGSVCAPIVAEFLKKELFPKSKDKNDETGNPLSGLFSSN